MPSGIYIHIPFCVKKCAYCDFLSFAQTDNEEPYVTALLREIHATKFATEIDTVYIGGGTPTALPPFLLCKILAEVAKLPLTADAEITVEANPGTIDEKYLQALKKHGANRLSLGLQTTHSHLLETLGRMHSPEDFYENFHAARRAGFDNINVDLMFALPRQTEKNWLETLECIIALSPEHISAYSLTPAENTLLWEQLQGGLSLPDEETDRNMYHAARRMLGAAGYSHYEISNFAKRGRVSESRHNVNCWTMKPYRGFGLGAHSFDFVGDGAARWHNTEDMKEYLATAGQAVAKDSYIALSQQEVLSEEIMLGLRMTCGVNKNKLAAFENEAAKLVAEGLLFQNGNNLALTERGLDLANRVFSVFV